MSIAQIRSSHGARKRNIGQIHALKKREFLCLPNCKTKLTIVIRAKKKQRSAKLLKHHLGTKITTKTTRCKSCVAIVAEMKGHKKTWQHAFKILKSRYESSLPGYIRSLKYISPEKILARCHSMDETTKKQVRTNITVDYSWVVRTFGQEYAAFVAMLGSSSDNHIPVKKRNVIRMNKVIAKVQYCPGPVLVNYKEEALNVKLSSKPKEAPIKYKHAKEPFRCLDANNQTFRLSERDLLKHFDVEYVNFIKEHHNSGGYANVPVGAVRIHSTLHERPDLKLANAPALKYQQGNEDLCVVKSLVSALHAAGFVNEAMVINNQCELTKDSGQSKANRLQTTIGIAKHNLPKCFEFKHFKREEYNFARLKKNHIFLGIIETNDGHCNHAVSLFRNQIYDSNEKHAIKLSRRGLDYCSSDGIDDSKFSCFAEGYLIKCTRKGNSNSFQLRRRKDTHQPNT